jgi:hypothetical protein
MSYTPVLEPHVRVRRTTFLRVILLVSEVRRHHNYPTHLRRPLFLPSTIMGDNSAVNYVTFTVSTADYNEFLQFKATHPPSSSTIIAQSSNPAAFVSTSSLIDPWVLDFGAFDCMASNKSLLSHLSYSDTLPLVIVADGSKIKDQGLGLAHPLPNLFLDFVLDIPSCPFNLIFVNKLTRTHDYSILFTDNSVYVQDRRTGKIIGRRSESGGLYHLSPSMVCVSVAS